MVTTSCLPVLRGLAENEADSLGAAPRAALPTGPQCLGGLVTFARARVHKEPLASAVRATREPLAPSMRAAVLGRFCSGLAFLEAHVSRVNRSSRASPSDSRGNQTMSRFLARSFVGGSASAFRILQSLLGVASASARGSPNGSRACSNRRHALWRTAMLAIGGRSRRSGRRRASIDTAWSWPTILLYRCNHSASRTGTARTGCVTRNVRPATASVSVPKAGPERRSGVPVSPARSFFSSLAGARER